MLALTSRVVTGTIPALLAAVTLAACGSSARGADSPTAAVKTYMTSIANGDGAGACSVLTTSLQSRAVNTAKAQGLKASDCPSLFGQVKAHLAPAQHAAFLNAKVTSVTRTGNTATVTVSGATSQPTLAQNGGKWLITGGIGF